MKAYITSLVVLMSLTSIAFASKPKNLASSANPGAAHKTLEPMAGTWTYTSKIWNTADGKPIESTGISKMQMIMGGRYLQQNFTGTDMGKSFEGMGFVGYSNLEKKYETFWVDNRSTGMMKRTGIYDADTKTLKDSGKFSCSKSGKKTCEVHSDWKMIDNNNMVFTMSGPDAKTGKNFKQIEVTYKRTR